MSIISSSFSPSTISNTISTTMALTFDQIPLHHVVRIRLTKNNFVIWRAQLLPYLWSIKLMGYLDGTIAAPAKLVPSSTAAGADWSLIQPIISGMIRINRFLAAFSMSKEILHDVVAATMSKEAWDTLQRMFSS